MILASYVTWHYGRALRSGVLLFNNFLIFLFHFFSVSLLLKTYFSRFGRLGERYKRGLDLESFLSTFLINMLMRVVGAIVRTIFILIGLVSMAIVTILGVAFFLIWLLFPLVIFISFIFGVTLVFA